MGNSDYNQKRSKLEFVEWVNQWKSKRLNLSRLHELNRRNHESKLMHQEAFIVYRYLRLFYHDQNISVELRDGNQNFDAIIYGAKDEILEYLEVTCVPQENDHNLRHELADKGHFSLLTQLTHNPSLDFYATLVSQGIKKKLIKNYPSGTTLLVELASEMILEDVKRFQFVISKMDSNITSENFSKIVIFDELGTCSHTIKSSDT